MTNDDPTLERFNTEANSARRWVSTVPDEAAVHAQLAQAHAINRLATFLGDLVGMLAEICERLEALQDAHHD